MGKKITQYPNNVSTNPDNLSLLDLSEKTGASTFESRKWNLTAFKAWVNSWVVAGAVAWNDITGKPTTIAGYGITDAVKSNNGTVNYVAKFTPDGTTIGNSQIIDNGTRLGIGVEPNINMFLYIVSANQGTTLRAISNFSGSGSGSGVDGYAQGAALGNNIGVIGSASNAANSNIGGSFSATGASGSKYSVQLKDGTEDSGKFLKSVTADGKANWANITASDISGVVDTTGGTANYISKFTDANTIEESQIIDDGTNIGIGTATPSAKLHINNTGSSESFRVEDETSVDSTPFIIDSAGNVGIGDFAPFTKLTVNGTSAILGTVNSNEGSLYIDHAGVSAWKIGVTSTNTSTLHIGNGTAFANKILNITNDEKVGVGTLTPSAKLDVNGDVKIKDGTEGEGKFLKSVTSDGKANWDYVPKVVQLAVSDETTALTTGSGKITFRMPYGMTLTEVRASLTTAQTSGSILTINVRENGGQIFSTKLTIDNTEKTSVTATTPYVLQDTSLGDDAEITVDIDQIGDGTAKGLKITLIGY